MEESSWDFNYSVEQMRMQRHDFMNYLQVIYGYIQLKKPEAALKYIMNINKTMTVLSRVFNLECPLLALMLQEFIFKLSNGQIPFQFYSEVEAIDGSLLKLDNECVKDAFNTATDILINEIRNNENTNKEVFIDIALTEEELVITGSNIDDFIEKINEEDFSREYLQCDSDLVSAIIYKSNCYIGFKYIIRSR